MTTFGTAQRQAMDRLLPTAGLPFRVLESIAYDPRAQDLSVEVTKIRALKPRHASGGDPAPPTPSSSWRDNGCGSASSPWASFSPGAPGPL